MAPPLRRPVDLDVGSLPPTVQIVDALARLGLAERRLGRELRLRNASQPLQELLAFVGIADALRVGPVGQPEEREQRLGVEEERELDDSAG